MATGDQADFVKRLKAQLPANWFPDVAPVRDKILNGNAANLASEFSLAQFAKAQMRVATQSGGFLDLTAFDLFGTRFARLANQSDASFSTAIQKEVLRPRQTRKAISQALIDLTGRTPIIIEAANPSDTAAYSAQSYYSSGGALYGSLLCTYQVFITAYRPLGGGIANVAGYGYGYYGAYTTRYVDISEVQAPVPDSAIYRTIAQTIAAGVTAWVQILS